MPVGRTLQYNVARTPLSCACASTTSCRQIRRDAADGVDADSPVLLYSESGEKGLAMQRASQKQLWGE